MNGVRIINGIPHQVVGKAIKTGDPILAKDSPLGEQLTDALSKLAKNKKAELSRTRQSVIDGVNSHYDALHSAYRRRDYVKAGILPELPEDDAKLITADKARRKLLSILA